MWGWLKTADAGSMAAVSRAAQLHAAFVWAVCPSHICGVKDEEFVA